MSQEQSSAPLLLETIKIEDGKIHNIHYHQNRCTKSRQTLFHSSDVLDLSSLIDAPKTGLYRCRILYGEVLHSIEYIPYTPKEIQRLKIVSSDIEYSLKYADRDALNTLLESNKDVDEVIIEKNGYLTLVNKYDVELEDYATAYAKLYPYNDKKTDDIYEPKSIWFYQLSDLQPRIEVVSELDKIGRASCRERVEMWGGERAA